jgi:hypothetical protein
MSSKGGKWKRTSGATPASARSSQGCATPGCPYARLVRVGRLAIPAIVVGKIWNAWGDCFRCWRVFDLRGHELPFALAMAPLLIAFETSGMWAAYGDRGIGGSFYR